MKKVRTRKKQKKLIMLVAAVIVAILAIILVASLVNKKTEQEPETPNEPIGVQLPETIYSEMQVKNIVMELLKGNAQDGTDETMISFEIVNTTENKVESQSFEAILMDADGNEIARMPHNYIQELEVGESQGFNVVYEGDLTATTQIKLIEK